MATQWVVFTAVLCILGGGYAAPCECDPESHIAVATSTPLLPVFTQSLEKVTGPVLPYVVDAVEDGSPSCTPVLASALPPKVTGVPSGQPVLTPALDAEGKPLPLPTPLSFAIPIPPAPPASSVFSLLSQAQSGDPATILSQISKLLATTLPCPHLQAAAAASPPPQEPCDMLSAAPPPVLPAAAPSNVPAAPLLQTPTIPVKYLGPPPSILAPAAKVEPFAFNLPPTPCEDTLVIPTLRDAPVNLDSASLVALAALQQQGNLGLNSLSPEIQAQLNLATATPSATNPVPSDTPPVSFEFPKFGQATSQFLNPWTKMYDPIRRLYRHHCV